MGGYGFYVEVFFDGLDNWILNYNGFYYYILLCMLCGFVYMIGCVFDYGKLFLWLVFILCYFCVDLLWLCF